MADFRYTLAWSNPNTEPPANAPRVLLTVESSTSNIPPEILEAWRPGGGYAVRCEPLAKRPGRRWSPAAKARVRRLNLERRLRRRHPLFADLFYREEVARRPGYFFSPDEEMPGDLEPPKPRREPALEA